MTNFFGNTSHYMSGATSPELKLLKPLSPKGGAEVIQMQYYGTERDH